MSLKSDWDEETAALLSQVFVQEAREHLDAISSAAIKLRHQPQALKEILRRVHTLKGSAATVGFFAVEKAAHALEDHCLKSRSAASSDEQKLSVSLLAALEPLRTLTHGDLTEERQAQLLTVVLKRLNVDSSAEQKAALASTAPSLVHGSPERRKKTAPELRTTERRRDSGQLVRVNVGQLDELLGAIGQLVIDRTRIERRLQELKVMGRRLAQSRRRLHGAAASLPANAEDPALTILREVDSEFTDGLAQIEHAVGSLVENANGLRRSTGLLQRQLNRIRMTPVRWLYLRLEAPLREMAHQEGKEIELCTTGESTAIDRSVVERITDSMVHLIRNAVAHGIEPPTIRQRAGKNPRGKIALSANHEGDTLVLQVADDGAGIDLETLRKTARLTGVVDVSQMTDDDLLDLVFTPGFSTRQKADGLAGRGIGLDIVRHAITGLGGDIRVASAPGQGTQFTIRLPLTTAITQALLFKSQGDEVYAIPVSHVVTTVNATAEDIEHNESGALNVRLSKDDTEAVPLLPMQQILGYAPPPLDDSLRRPLRQSVVLLACGNIHFALSCRKVIGTREIVLKPLGTLLEPHPLFASATISGSGKVQFVLDIAVLADFVQSTQLGHSIFGILAQIPAPMTGPLRQKRILLADDSVSIRQALGTMLRDAGYAVDVVLDGAQAWERLQGEGYDLLITDLQMPRLTGLELIQRCRKEPQLAWLPILVLTSKTAEQNQAATLAAGANAFVSKPLERELIFEQVAALLK